MKKKYWSKLLPNTSAVVLGDPDEWGFAPAYITTDDGATRSGAVKLEEWSTVETVPAPDSVPDTGYLVMYGADPSEVSYEFHESEVDAAVASNKKRTSFGYVPVLIQRYATIPPLTK